MFQARIQSRVFGRVACALASACVVMFAGAAQAQTNRQERDKPKTYRNPAETAAAGEGVGERAAGVLSKLAEDGDFADAAKQIDAIWRYTIAYVPVKEAGTFRSVAQAYRTVMFCNALARTDHGEALEVVRFLRASPVLAQTLVFLVIPEAESAPEVLKVLAELRAAGEKDLEKHAALAAAICVVYDKPIVRQINENEAKGPAPADLFRFFVKNDANMIFKSGELPAELMVYAVNTAATIEELGWAQQKYRNQRDVGQRYKEIKYDAAHFKKGTPKKVSEVGFTLQNILKFGGVCADQAHFAATVGQSLGVPAAYVTGQSGEVSHAWVGYLRSAGGRGVEWNFDSGRYDDYDVVRGSVTDPQTGRSVADGNIAVLAEAAAVDAQSRQAGIAMVDAAIMARFLQGKDKKDLGAWPPEIEGLTVPKDAKARDLSTRSQLELLDAGLRAFPASPRGWYFLVGLAKEGKLSLAEKQAWGATLDKLTGGKYPDFSMDVLLPMVQTVKDTAEQSGLLDAMFASFKARPDLAAKVRSVQGQMWEKAGDLDKAQRCFDEIADKFLSDGPFAVAALVSSERLLEARHNPGLVLPMYKKAFARVRKPKGMAPQFAAQSNWFRIGARYAKLLSDAGQTAEAQRIRKQIGLEG